MHGVLRLQRALLSPVVVVLSASLIPKIRYINYFQHLLASISANFYLYAKYLACEGTQHADIINPVELGKKLNSPKVEICYS